MINLKRYNLIIKIPIFKDKKDTIKINQLIIKIYN